MPIILSLNSKPHLATVALRLQTVFLAQVNLQDTVRVTNVYAAINIGEVISQDGARNQIEGGIVQATSWTLKEFVSFSGSTVQAETWLDYPILQFSEVPRVFIDVIDRPDLRPLGCGEVSQAPTVAAIGNAVRDALVSAYENYQ